MQLVSIPQVPIVPECVLILLRRLKLKQFQKFDSAVAALNEAAALTEGKVSDRDALLCMPRTDN